MKENKLNSPIFKYSKAEQTTPTINRHSKQVSFSPIIGVRLFEKEYCATIWGNTYDTIEVNGSDEENERPTEMIVESSQSNAARAQSSNDRRQSSCSTVQANISCDSSQSNCSTSKAVSANEILGKSQNASKTKKRKHETKARTEKKSRRCRKVVSDDYIIEKVLGRRLRNEKVEFLIKWKGFSTNRNSWEPEENLDEKLVNEINKIINED